MVALLACAACGEKSPTCEAGACPVGFACLPATGACQLGDSAAAQQARFFGRFALVLRENTPWVIGYVPDRQSVAAFDGKHLSYLGGPAAEPGAPPAGKMVAAVQTESGQLLAAWVRPADHTVWLASEKGGGWQAAAIDKNQTGAVADPIALGAVGDRAVLAMRQTATAALAVAEQQANGAWTVAAVPMPAAPRAGLPASSDVGRSLAMLALPNGPAISAYDATYGDLILAVRSADQWSSIRLAGWDSKTSQDDGDAGDPSALALAPDGALLVAYRDAKRGEIRLARVAGGSVTVQTVQTGLTPGPAGTQTLDLLGTALAMGVRPDGRIGMAWFNGSAWRASLLLQRANGTFATAPATATAAATLNLFPSLAIGADGAAWFAYIDVGHGRAPSAGRLAVQSVAAGAWP